MLFSVASKILREEMSAPPKMNALTHLADVRQSCCQQRITVGAGTQAGFSNRLIHSLEHIKDPLSRPVHLHIVSTQFCRDACPLTYTENTVRLGGISHQRNLLTKPEDWRWRRAWQWSFNAAKQVLNKCVFSETEQEQDCSSTATTVADIPDSISHV